MSGQYEINTLAELINWKRPSSIPESPEPIKTANSVTWNELIQGFDWTEINQFLLQNQGNFWPNQDQILRAFRLTPLGEVRVVIIGQDPYYTSLEGNPVADGLSFSVTPGAPIPPSLVNIRKEIKACYPEISLSPEGNLDCWAKQGVLMLNRTLTCRRGQPDNSDHQKIWAPFFDWIMQNILAINPEVVIVAWGRKAQDSLKAWENSLSRVPTSGKAYLLECPHPSPRARGFSGNGHFRKINDYLENRGSPAIDWSM